ncbi:helix-turn-helix domain-containing protein [Campylobacter lari]|uniref:Helix-turn-helix domain-containing protein n=1 Tax=Campylobacter lari TaxID=201 RepID=A0A7U8AQZ6_CAMLA|nr:helix-turn-helix domain-containing protein [Campylobacter lari]
MKLLSTKEVAQYLGFSVDRVRKMRMRKNQAIYNFPKGVKVGKVLMYEKKEIDDWIKSCKVS